MGGGTEDTATLGRAEGKESGKFVANKLDFPSILFRCRRCSAVQSRAALFPSSVLYYRDQEWSYLNTLKS